MNADTTSRPTAPTTAPEPATADQENTDTALEALITAARAARHRSHAPYSNFLMGAAVLTEDGTVHPGALVESISLGLAMCAERVALFNAVTAGHGAPVALALVSRRTSGEVTTPCGACLQVAAEHGDLDMVIICEDTAGRQERYVLRDLAPRLPRRQHDNQAEPTTQHSPLS